MTDKGVADKRIYTIGYASFDIEEFINALKYYGVNCLIDVRSVPASSFFPVYDRKALEKRLKGTNILYRHYSEFGARQSDREYYSKEGYLDFNLYLQSPLFHKGVERILAGMRMNYCFALMCAEKDPMNCHRGIMVARGFDDIGYDVQHIRTDNNGQLFLENQRELEKRLISSQGENPEQISMLETMEERVSRAYRRQNERIGYKMNEN